MKTLLFNGCSFVAGDDLGWNYSNGHPTDSPKLWNIHKENRKAWNLSAKCAAELNTSAVDLSIDGNSNCNISFKTINYIQTLSVEEKNNLHVCIGWTDPYRFLHFIEFKSTFDNIHPISMHVDKESTWFKNSYWIKLFEYISEYTKAIVKYKKNIDSFLPYLSEVLLLENFLIANNITYTFWRSLGPQINNIDRTHLNKLIDTNNISNNKSWINFDSADLNRTVWLGNTWRNLGEPISISYHPTEESVIKQKDRICTNIKNQLF
jgi:hypothetical protein